MSRATAATGAAGAVNAVGTGLGAASAGVSATSSAAGARASPPPGADPLQQARHLVMKREFARADTLLHTLLGVRGIPSAPVHHLLAISAVLQEQGAAAVHHARLAADGLPEDAQVHFTLGRAHRAARSLPQAVAAYRRALKIEPRYAEAWVSLGIALRQQGELDEAIACQRRAIALAPHLGVAHANLANALAQHAAQTVEHGSDTDPDDATQHELLRATEQALVLDPDNAALHRNHGELLLRARRRREAADAYNRALGIEPAHIECCLRLGHCLSAIGAGGSAVELYQRWLERHPDRPAAPVMRMLAEGLTREGRVDEALPWAERSVQADPDPSGYVQLSGVYQQCRRLDEAVAAGREAIQRSAGRHESYPVTLMAMCYASDDAQALHRLHVEYGRALPPAGPRPLPRDGAASGGRLRVGYVSGDFVWHSVAYFIAPLLEHHDRARFEVFCYHNRGWSDAVTERLRSYGAHWVDCEGLSNAALHRRIEADGIDILVDLSGHTAHSRLAVLARRVAPLQLGYLGYPTITGVPAVDRRVTDTTIDPGDMPAADGERPLALPRSMFCYRPEEAVPIEPKPASQRTGVVTFGSFNNIAKLSDRTLALWARVLQAVPGSRLLLKSTAMAASLNRESLVGFMVARGIDAGRLTLAPRIAQKQEHLALYNEVDVALDPYPYNGATTTCEALWMGVPVVSRRGPTHPSRMGASLLRAVGRGSWVTTDDEAYVALAAALAADEAGRAAWRAVAREVIEASELRDERGFVRHFESALEEAWQEVVRAAPGDTAPAA